MMFIRLRSTQNKTDGDWEKEGLRNICAAGF